MVNRRSTWGPVVAALAGVGALGCEDEVIQRAPVLASIRVDPARARVAPGAGLKLEASGTYTDGAVQDVSRDPRLSWRSRDEAFAIVDNTGYVIGVAEGQSVITASFDRPEATMRGEAPVQPGSALVEVSSARVVAVELEPASLTLNEGDTRSVIARCTYEDGLVEVCSGLEWRAVDEQVCTCSHGQVTALGTGETDCEARHPDGPVATTRVNVGRFELLALACEPTSLSIPLGARRAVTVLARYTGDVELDVTGAVEEPWHIDPPRLVSITAGEVVGREVGSGTITASYRGASCSVTVEVTPAVALRVELDPGASSVALGSRQCFTATLVSSNGSTEVTESAEWRAQSPAIAAADATVPGCFDGRARGITEVYARDVTSALEGAASLEVRAPEITGCRLVPSGLSLIAGERRQLEARAVDSTGAALPFPPGTALTWGPTSDPLVATVNATGIVDAIGPGFADISLTAVLAAGVETCRASVFVAERCATFPGDFEAGMAPWSADNGVWEAGSPTTIPPAGSTCHEGLSCAGTNLSGNYPEATDTRLLSPRLTLCSIVPGQQIALWFWQSFSWYLAQVPAAGCSPDRGTVRVRVWDPATSAWSTWSPELLGPLTGASPDWANAAVDLTPYAGETIQVAFYHQDTSRSPACNTTQDVGWYIDDVSIVRF